MPEIIIRRGRPTDVMDYLVVCQRSAAQAYSTPQIEAYDLFGPQHFFHDNLMPYWGAMATNSQTNHWWVAEDSSLSKIVGGICLTEHDGYFEGRGFYVEPAFQGQGIGRSLVQTRDEQVNRPLVFEVYAHAQSTIEYHKRHGASPTGAQRQIHWPSWPDNVNLIALEFIK